MDFTCRTTAIVRTARLRLVGAVAQLVDRPDVEHAHHAGHHAVGLAAGVDLVDAHVALGDDVLLGNELRRAERTGRLAAAAADAQRDESMSTMPSFLRLKIAPVGQVGRQAGSAQWLHDMFTL